LPSPLGWQVAFSAIRVAPASQITPKNERLQADTIHALRVGMARSRRIQIADLTQHVFNRGNNRCDIFRAGRDYAFFLLALRDAALRFQVDIHSYTLMTNHFHLVATPRITAGLSDAMQVVGTKYVRYFNKRYARTGTLFEGPFKNSVIETETYWFTCMRYVELNPVRAGLVADPREYRWSSYRANAFGVSDALIVQHPLYLALGVSGVSRQERWRELCGQVISAEDLFEIRDAIRRGGALSDAPQGLEPDLEPRPEPHPNEVANEAPKFVPPA
jgi:putative transposase